MKSIIWKSEERIIPGHGVASPGKPIALPDELADKHVGQGEAEFEVKRSDQKTRRTNEEVQS